MTRARARAVALAVFAGLLVLAAWARLAIYPHVFARGELIPQIDGDSFFHLKRILATLRDFPRVPHFDAWMNWPRGAFIPWADGFDLGGAVFALLSGGRGRADVALVAVVLWPVVVGILAVAATYRMVRVGLPSPAWTPAALAAAAGAALIPGSIFVGLLGRVDHHGAEALLFVLLVTWAMRAFPSGGRAAPARPWGFEAAGAFLSGLSVWTFSGSVVYVAIVAPALVVAAARSGRVIGCGGVGLLGGAALSLLLNLPFVRDSGEPWTFRFPSLLPPLAVAACGAGLLASAWVLSGSGGTRRRRALWVAAAGSGGLAVLGLATPVLGQIADAVTGWLLHRDPWIDGIQEFAPMLRPSKYGVSPWTSWHQEFGWGGFFFPVAFLVVAARLGRRARVATLLYAALVATLLALVSNRYSRVVVPLMAACNGIAVATVFRRLWGRRAAGRLPIWAPLAIVLASVVDLPTLGLLVPPRPKVQPVVDVAIQLRDHPPGPTLPRGVLSNWTYGHQLEVLAGLPVVVNGFGSYLDPPRFWEAVEVFRGTGAELDRYMVGNRLGVLVAGFATIGQEVTGADESVGFAGGALNKVYMQSLPLSPLLIAGSAIPGWDVPHLPHLMPRYASSAVVGGLGFKLPYLWSYERVEGARLRGTAPPGARVQAELPFSEHRRPHVYKAFTEAGADGSWELVVPFPSGRRDSAIRSDPEWTASAGGDPVRFRVSEEDVREGRAIDVGPLPAPLPGG